MLVIRLDSPTFRLRPKYTNPTSRAGLVRKIGYGLGASSGLIGDHHRSLLQTPWGVNRFRALGDGQSDGVGESVSR